MDDGAKKGVSITNGYFHISQPERPLELSEFESNKMKIRLIGKDWTSDQQNCSIDLTDDHLFYSVVLTGERGGMDMDVDNSGG